MKDLCFNRLAIKTDALPKLRAIFARSREEGDFGNGRYLYFYNNKRYRQRLKYMTPMEFHSATA